MPETLLTPSGIKLYGRLVTDLILVADDRAKVKAAGASQAIVDSIPAPNYTPPGLPPGVTKLGANTFLKKQLADSNARLARIYGFSFEGHNYALPKPAIFLVHTEGTEVIIQGPQPLAAGGTTGGGRTTLDASGVVARDWEFAASDPNTRDLRMWEYDKGDFSIRLDVETGPFEDILLEAALRGGSAYSSGADLRTSGADLRTSGADLRISGADLRIKR
jgi:hypothetical protein